MSGRRERSNGTERAHELRGRRPGRERHSRSAHRQTRRRDDPFFTGLNAELADKGFLVTTADDLITWARTGSLMWMTFGLGLLRGRDDADVDAAL